jgi:hypothetical protein
LDELLAFLGLDSADETVQDKAPGLSLELEFEQDMDVLHTQVVEQEDFI